MRISSVSRLATTAKPRPQIKPWRIKKMTDSDKALLEWFAGMALIGLSMASDRGSVEVVAAESFRMAEAMLAEAERRSK